MSNVATENLRFSYREAARLMDRDRRAIAEIAKQKRIELADGGKPLDAKGFRRIAKILNVDIEIPRSRLSKGL